MATTKIKPKSKPAKSQVKKRFTTVKIYLPNNEMLTFTTDPADRGNRAESITYDGDCLSVTSRGVDHTFNGLKFWITSWFQE